MVLVTLFLLSAAVAQAQVPIPISPTDATQNTTQIPADAAGAGTTQRIPGQDAGVADSSGILGSSSQSGGTMALPAGQIIAILQQRPEVVIELKSMLADELQQQGTQVRADDITDEMLYNQIATNAEARARITTLLRARGYVSQDTLQTLAAGVDDPNATGDLSTSQVGGLLTGGEPGGTTAQGTSSGLSGLGSALGRSSGAATTAMPMGNTVPYANRSTQTPAPRADQAVTASTDEPKVLRRPAPYNLQSMRDLYTQIPENSAPLKRFGSEVFLNRTSSAISRGGLARDTPLDVPLGPDYILGPGDTLTITIWGGTTQNIARAVDRDGRVLLPEAGPIEVAGLSLERAQSAIEAALKPQYRNAKIAVTVSQLRSVRVYIVGDVQRPGGYDISALATPVSALYAAGGPTAAGSLRTLRHLRGNTLIEEVDLYDFLLHGLRKESARFQSGDTLLAPPAGPQIAISGAVKRPAIYELKNGESTLTSVVEDAGGVTVAASFGHITIERIDANQKRETIDLAAKGPQDNRNAMTAFQVKDGDRIRIAPIAPYSERVIYLEGHVERPGRQPYREGMHLNDVLHSYQDMLPEPAKRGEIVRLVAPDLHAETIAFDVAEVLIGNASIPLQPFDTIRIFGRYQMDAPRITINGEVQRPGSYPLSDGMTAAQLVRMAGGFKRDALQDEADLTTYTVVDGNKITGALTSVRIGAAVAGSDRSADVMLKPGDVLTIHQITGWNEIGQSVTIEGQVKYPGSYGFQEGEHLSSVLRRAGGFRETAYPTGAVLVREQVRELQEKSRQELIREIETSSAAARLSPNLGPNDSGATLQMIQAQQEQVLAKLRSEPPTGRLVVHISSDIDSWENTPADIELRRGDVLTIPKRPSFVLVTGQVYNATALTFSPGKTAKWYLQHAGGASSTANRKEIFVIRANGSVIGRHSGGRFDPDVLSTKLDPGDVVVVPQKVIGASLLWRNLLTAAQLASSIAITAAVASL